MSDVWQDEIDDVMDSIRRLVSEDGGIKSTTSAQIQNDQRLVLTPQLRVTEPEDPYKRITSDQTVHMTKEETVAAEVRELISEITTPIEEDTNHPLPLMDHSDQAAPEAPMIIDAPIDDVPVEQAIATVTTFRRREKSASRIKRSEFMASPADVADKPETVQIENIDTPNLEVNLEDVSDTVEEIENSERVAPGKPVSDHDEVETTAEEISDTDTSSNDQNDLTSLLNAGIAETVEAKIPELDRDELRDMIADVVREELSGPLGERITRNVRKLVRRELQLVMSREEFE